MDENLSLNITDLKNKEQVKYIATGCIRWMGEVIKKSTPNSPVIRTLWEGILMETAGHMTLKVRRNHISKIIENRWYQVTDIAIRNYYGNKLSTSPITIFEEIEQECTLDWSDVDIPNYLNY